MTGSVRLTYEQMLQNCTTLKAYADEYEQTAQNVTNIVSSFTGAWEGEAEAKFEEDYNVLTNAMRTAINTMNEITVLAENYVNSMQEIEAAYGKNHVSVG